MRPLNNKNESCGYVTTMEEVILGGSLVILSFRPFMEGLTQEEIVLKIGRKRYFTFKTETQLFEEDALIFS